MVVGACACSIGATDAAWDGCDVCSAGSPGVGDVDGDCANCAVCEALGGAGCCAIRRSENRTTVRMPFTVRMRLFSAARGYAYSLMQLCWGAATTVSLAQSVI